MQTYTNDPYVHMVPETAYNKFHPNYVFMPLACNFHLIAAYCGLRVGGSASLLAWPDLQLVNVTECPSVHLSVRRTERTGNLPCAVVGATDAPAFQRTIRKLIIKDFDDEYNDDYGDVDIEIQHKEDSICTACICQIRFLWKWEHCLLTWTLLCCLIYNIERSIIKQKNHSQCIRLRDDDSKVGGRAPQRIATVKPIQCHIWWKMLPTARFHIYFPLRKYFKLAHVHFPFFDSISALSLLCDNLWIGWVNLRGYIGKIYQWLQYSILLSRKLLSWFTYN